MRRTPASEGRFKKNTQLHNWLDIRSIQQMIYFTYHYKLKINTLMPSSGVKKKHGDPLPSTLEHPMTK